MKKLFCYFFALSAIVWGQPAVSPTINPLPTRQFGHPNSENVLNVPTQGSPNLVEGREFDIPAQIAFDNSVSPPILYVADIGNSRVLAFKDPANLSNGKMADLVIGQQDFVSTLAQGPSTALTTGLSSPTGVAVDSKGNLYVADAGNNRIMRFPTPFAQASQSPGTPPQPDLVIGQQNFGTGNSSNEGGNCSAKTLSFSRNGNTQLITLAIDASGNLWVTDAYNDRVLMYTVANLTPYAVAPVASVVLGQNDFITCTQPSGNLTQLTKTAVIDPSGLAFDATGNLYVADGFSRVLYFQAPFAAQGQAALRVLGIAPQSTSGGTPVYPTQYTLGAPNPANNNNLTPPNGVFTLGNNLYVADTPEHRIVKYDIPANWAAESTAFPSPGAIAVYGQVGFSAGSANQGQAQPNSSTLFSPYGGAFLGNQMWVADSGNNRVLGFSLNAAATYSNATILVGQLDYPYNAPNLIVGSEVSLSSVAGSASAIAVDLNSNPPHLYVADPGNNRILCFSDVRKVSQGTALSVADIVIGQPDLRSSVINYPGGLAGSPSQSGLYNPIGLAVDNNGNLYVADSGNARVVRFPAPFAQPAGRQQTANLVLGQQNFNAFIQNASASSMRTPWGLALFADATGATPLAGSLAVSDPGYNRVLIFKKPASGDFTNGQPAASVLGQSSFSGIAAGAGPASFNNPRGIASDTSDRLYVADSQNGRILEFTQVPETAGNGPTSTNSLGNLSTPQAVAINSQTTELWVANTNNGQVLRYPQYTTCQTTTCQATASLSSYVPLGLALDGAGNVIVGDVSNRITFYYPAVFFRNAANFNTQPLAPGMLAVLGRYGLPMSIKDGATTTNPWSTTLSDLNVTVNGVLAPIFATNAAYGAIYFQVPYETPTSGTANYIVTQVSTGLVLGVGTFQMALTNPGFFAISGGVGPVAATNADLSANTASNGAARGSTVTFYLTGLGNSQGTPADGFAPSVASNAAIQPILYIQGIQATVTYSGPGAFAGGWQINATIPMNTVPNGANSVVLTYRDVSSNIGGTTSTDGISPGRDSTPIQLTIYVGK